jgi:hypothetical protein
MGWLPTHRDDQYDVTADKYNKLLLNRLSCSDYYYYYSLSRCKKDGLKAIYCIYL